MIVRQIPPTADGDEDRRCGGWTLCPGPGRSGRPGHCFWRAGGCAPLEHELLIRGTDAGVITVDCN